MMKWLQMCGALLLVAGINGCMVGPNYRPPSVPVPDAWSEASTQEKRAAVTAQWWTTFQDPVLESLITRAVQANRDLRTAAGRVREARALRRLAAGNLGPTINVSGAYTRQRFSENALTLPSGTGSGGTSGAGSPSFQREQDLFQTGFDASWEIDLFGGVRRSIEAANADLAAAREGLRDTLVSVLAEVASNYIEVRGLQRRLAIAEENIKAQQDTLEITRARFNAGLTSELDVTQAASQLATTQAQVPSLETSLKQGIHRLGVLTGQAPGALLTELSTAAPIPSAPPEVLVGLPADLLRRRPDVRQAERQLAAATARIGVATADLYPKLSLTGTLGLESVKLADLPKGASRFWSVGPTLSWPIFDAGRIRANIAVQDARTEQQLSTYEQTVLKALEDVENALVAYSREQVRHDKLADAVAANQQAVAMANELYRTGLDTFLNVLDSERALFASQSDLAQSEATIATDVVALYKALGGGWETFAPTPEGQNMPAVAYEKTRAGDMPSGRKQ
jgi:NodT family efflux transporter outer membrane factor (OMF) lipoprotein